MGDYGNVKKMVGLKQRLKELTKKERFGITIIINGKRVVVRDPIDNQVPKTFRTKSSAKKEIPKILKDIKGKSPSVVRIDNKNVVREGGFLVIRGTKKTNTFKKVKKKLRKKGRTKAKKITRKVRKKKVKKAKSFDPFGF